MRHCTRNIQAAKLQKKQQTTKQHAVQFSATKSRFISKQRCSTPDRIDAKAFFKKKVAVWVSKTVCLCVYI